MQRENSPLDIYREDLQGALGGLKGMAFKFMTRAIERYGEGVLDVPDEAVKVWSDLHIGHANIIRYCNRPFENVEEMDATLWSNWQMGVEPGETLVCVGDMWFGFSSDPRPVPEGHQKLLVIGNHDLTKGGNLRVTEFDDAKALLTSEGDPKLIFTHAPLPNVPQGCVNVHGHTHQNTRPPDSPHINVSVEQLEYSPIGLERLRLLARAIIDGEAPEGETRMERVRIVE